MAKDEHTSKSHSVDPLDRFVKAKEMATYLPFSQRKLYDLAKLNPPAIPCHPYLDAISGRTYISFNIREVLEWLREKHAGPSVREHEITRDSRK